MELLGSIFNFAPSWMLIALAGIWPTIGYFSAGTGLLAALLAAAWFSPVFKKEFLWGAGVVGAFLFAFGFGVVTGEKRVRAQWTASIQETVKQGNKARKRAERYVARKPLDRVQGTDRFDRDRR